MSASDDAALAGALFAIDPAGTGGVCIRSSVHPARDQWLKNLRDLLPAETPLRRIPFNIADGRLLGGLDLAATIQARRPIAERGVLAAADGGVLVVSMAERLTPHTAACINTVLDAGEVALRREGVCIRERAQVGIVALDEGVSDEECLAGSLLDRLAFVLDFNGLGANTILRPVCEREQILAARRLLPHVRCDPTLISALCAAAAALGVASPRVSMLAMRVARAAAALNARTTVGEADATAAGRLVLARRATIAPASEAADASEPQSARGPDSQPAQAPQVNAGASSDTVAEGDLDDTKNLVLAATQAAIPSGLLARLYAAEPSRLAPSAGVGRAGAQRSAGARGRPCGIRRGLPRPDARLNLIETLRAAAPWQSLRGRDRSSRVLVSRDDFRVTRYRHPAQTLTIFAVDASGSLALHRLAEAKGAVELLLAECYIRRDQVAVIAFRGRAAEVILPPTRSLVRAKRSLAELAGGGGTPLAAAIEAAAKIANQARRRGETPTIVMLTDGRANVLRSGAGGHGAAQSEALRAAAAVRAAKINALFIDTSPRSSALAKDLARMMNAQYIPLPFADARRLSDVVKATSRL